MMNTRSVIDAIAIGSLLAIAACLFPASAGWAENILLKDDTKISAQVVRINDDGVILHVPREAIATIDGEPLPPVLAKGVKAPAFKVKDINGATQAVGKNKSKHKLTVLHFWISWCPYCRKDAPKIQEAYDRYKDNKDVRVLTVSLDKDRSKLDNFIKERSVTYPVIYAKEQAEAADGVDVPGLYHITGFPVTYLIDRNGVINRKLNGSFVAAGLSLVDLITESLPAE